jgi:hypothetical protein
VRSGMVLDSIRVQPMKRADGRSTYTILWPDGSVHEEADSFLRSFEGSGTQKAYVCALVDHLRWRVREELSTTTVTLEDLHRYMAAVGARMPMPYGQPWRMPPKRPYTTTGLGTAAAVLKGFYLHQCVRQRVNDGLRSSLEARRLPTQADRSPARRILSGPSPVTARALAQ